MEELGIRSRSEMRRLRRAFLHEAEDWRIEGGHVAYMDSGLRKIAAALSLAPAPPPGGPPDEKTAPCPAGEPGPPYLLAYVRRRPYGKNRRILVAELEGHLINVRVRDHGNFIPNTPTGAVVVQETKTGWEFSGRPEYARDESGTWCFQVPENPTLTPHHPRWPGRW